MAKNVAQAKWTMKTSKPWGQSSAAATPLPKPKPAAHNGVNNTEEINALGR